MARWKIRACAGIDYERLNGGLDFDTKLKNSLEELIKQNGIVYLLQRKNVGGENLRICL